MSDQRETRRRISAAQWFAARAVAEGEMPTRRLVAATLGCDDSAVYSRAAQEGWKRLDFRTSVARTAHREFMERVSGVKGEGGPEAGPEGSSAAGADATAASPEAGDMTAGADAATEAAGAAEPAQAEAIRDDEAGDPLALLARSTRVLARRLANLVSRAEAGGRLNKVEIDGLLALARMTERWETLARERAKQEETQSDEEIADILRKVDLRIIELAREETARILAKGTRPRWLETGA